MIDKTIAAVKNWLKTAAVRDIVLAASVPVLLIFGAKLLAGVGLGLFLEVKFGILEYLKFNKKEE